MDQRAAAYLACALFTSVLAFALINLGPLSVRLFSVGALALLAASEAIAATGRTEAGQGVILLRNTAFVFLVIAVGVYLFVTLYRP